MKRVDQGAVSLDDCLVAAQRDRVVVVRNGKPVALIIGVEGLDEDQLQLGSSDRFWKLMSERRAETTISRSELEQRARAAEE